MRSRARPEPFPASLPQDHLKVPFGTVSRRIVVAQTKHASFVVHVGIRAGHRSTIFVGLYFREKAAANARRRNRLAKGVDIAFVGIFYKPVKSIEGVGGPFKWPGQIAIALVGPGRSIGEQRPRMGSGDRTEIVATPIDDDVPTEATLEADFPSLIGRNLQ